MKIVNWMFLLGFVVVFISCDNDNSQSIQDSPENELEANSDDDFEVVYWKNPNSTNDVDTNDMAELIKIWNWNETIAVPSKSSIRNFKFKKENLLQSWSSDREELPMFSFTLNYFSVENGGDFIYSINHDSLRIFTSYERPGDGHERGIIQKLTRDSLVILYSDGDLVKYVAVDSQ